jgi:hypothetical protein
VVVFDSFGSNTQQPSYVTRALQASLLASFLQRLSVALVVVVFDSSGDPMGSKCLEKKKSQAETKNKKLSTSCGGPHMSGPPPTYLSLFSLSDSSLCSVCLISTFPAVLFSHSKFVISINTRYFSLQQICLLN